MQPRYLMASVGGRDVRGMVEPDQRTGSVLARPVLSLPVTFVLVTLMFRPWRAINLMVQAFILDSSSRLLERITASSQ